MLLLIPLGGTGERFKKNNYKEPKALIKLFGRPIIFYLLDNLSYDNIDMVIIPYNKEYKDYRFESLLRKEYPHIKFYFIPLIKNTDGAAETINIALKELKMDDMPILCLDGDNFYTSNVTELWKGRNVVMTIEDTESNPIYSYINIINGKIHDIVEKEKISNYACTGAYGYSSYKTLLKYTQYILDNDIRQKDEYYTSNVIKQMINSGIDFANEIINVGDWHCLGTPLQIRHFYNNYPKISFFNNKNNIKPLRFCFDFDNTLVTYPTIMNDYTSVLPIQRNIEFLKYLKKFGHTIIIYTARRMNSTGGNLGKTMHDIGMITFETLKRFDIPYDEIYFGKPYAHYYIDDLAVNCFDDMEKSIGFYMDNIMPRDHNMLMNNMIETFTKKSEDLSGEIYYYNNIPRELKDLFPLMIDYTDDMKSYMVEKINGITVTSLYLSELLTESQLKHIMNSINRIHSHDSTDMNSEVNIYSNYVIKLEKRYKEYDYSLFKNSETTFKMLVDGLKKYEDSNSGKKVLIHGDPVFTNIMVNSHGKIKFIDMRGKLGDKLTLYGDWLYDWAKLYQSLCGYDSILMGKTISHKYVERMKKCYIDYFTELYGDEHIDNLKLITKSLIFTLLPLHNNNKCDDYYNMISALD